MFEGDNALIESEALWGNDIKEDFRKLFKLVHELWVAVTNYLEIENPDTDPDHKRAIHKISRKKRDILYDDLSRDEEFRSEITLLVQAIEDKLKPKLARK